MDPNDVNIVLMILIAMQSVLETKREKKRLGADELELEEKQMEISLLKTKKLRLLAEEAAKQKLVDVIMVFIGAIENNDLETARNFDEKSIMNTVATMLNSDGGVDNGGFPTDHGGVNIHPENRVLMMKQTARTGTTATAVEMATVANRSSNSDVDMLRPPTHYIHAGFSFMSCLCC